MKTPRRIFSFLLITAAVVSVSFINVNKTEAYDADCGKVLTADYTLTQDLDCSDYTGTALTITADNVTLDGAGYTITGNHSSYGVRAYFVGNMTIKNLTVVNASSAFDIEYLTSGGTFENITAHDSAVGFYAFSAAANQTGATFTNVDVTRNASGVSLSNFGNLDLSPANFILGNNSSIGMTLAFTPHAVIHDYTLDAGGAVTEAFSIYQGLGSVEDPITLRNITVSNYLNTAVQSYCYNQDQCGLLTIEDSTFTNDQYILYVNLSKVRINNVTANGGLGGLRIIGSKYFDVSNSDFSHNSGIGLSIEYAATMGAGDIQRVTNVTANYNGGLGVQAFGATAGQSPTIFTNVDVRHNPTGAYIANYGDLDLSSTSFTLGDNVTAGLTLVATPHALIHDFVLDGAGVGAAAFQIYQGNGGIDDPITVRNVNVSNYTAGVGVTSYCYDQDQCGLLTIEHSTFTNDQYGFHAQRSKVRVNDVTATGMTSMGGRILESRYFDVSESDFSHNATNGLSIEYAATKGSGDVQYVSDVTANYNATGLYAFSAAANQASPTFTNVDVQHNPTGASLSNFGNLDLSPVNIKLGDNVTAGMALAFTPNAEIHDYFLDGNSADATAFSISQGLGGVEDPITLRSMNLANFSSVAVSSYCYDRDMCGLLTIQGIRFTNNPYGFYVNMSNVDIRDVIVSGASAKGGTILASRNFIVSHSDFSYQLNTTGLSIEYTQPMGPGDQQIIDTVTATDNVTGISAFAATTDQAPPTFTDVDVANSTTGAYLANFKDLVLDANSFRLNNTGTGLYLSNLTNAQITGLDFGFSAGHRSGIGMQLFSSSNVTVDNSMIKNRDTAMQLNAVAGFTATLNTLDGNTTGFYLNGVTDHHITRNDITNSVTAAYSPDANIYELSDGGAGNFWGHTAAGVSCFYIYGGPDTPFDANRTGITDGGCARSSRLAEDTAPTVTIDSATNVNPVAIGSYTNHTYITFAYTGTDNNAVVSIECTLDDVAVPCSDSPLVIGATVSGTTTYTSLSEGDHSWKIKVTDDTGHISPVAEFRWTVDTIAPEVYFTGNGYNHDEHGNILYDGGFVNGNTLYLAFYGIDTGGIDLFNCSQEGGPYEFCHTGDFTGSQYEGSSVVDISSWTEGNHTLGAEAVDRAGNMNRASLSFAIDRTRPTVNLIGIDGTGEKIVFNGSTRSDTMNLIFSGTDPVSGGVASGIPITGFSCSLDGATPTTCYSPVHLTSITAGTHTFAVTARDNTRNVTNPPRIFTWTYVHDTTPPVVTIDSVTNVGDVAYYTDQDFIVFTYTATDDEAVVSATCALNDVAQPCSDAPIVPGPTISATVTYLNLDEGLHTWRITANDASGNISSEVQYEWLVDTITPIVRFNPSTLRQSTDDQGRGIGEGSYTGGRYIYFVFEGLDSYNLYYFNCIIDGIRTDYCATTRYNYEYVHESAYELDISSFAEGNHTFEIEAVDGAGNAGTAVLHYVIDRTPPTVSISAVNGAGATIANNGTSNSDTMKFTFSGSDPLTGGVASGITDLTCSLDGATPTTCTSPLTYTTLAYGPHTFTVTARDIAWNVTTPPASFTWTSTDQCPGIIGNLASTGCPSALQFNSGLKIVQPGNAAINSEMIGAEIRIFNPGDTSFVGAFGTNSSNYNPATVFESDIARAGKCITNNDGYCIAGVPAYGSKNPYYAILKYTDTITVTDGSTTTTKTVSVYVVASPVQLIASTANITAGDMGAIKKLNKDGTFDSYTPATKVVFTGSRLEVLMPDNSVWEGASRLFPFVFTSDSDWQIDVCPSVPQGYAIVGVYDGNENLIAGTNNCVQTFVANETKVIYFRVDDIGSPEPTTTFDITTRHHGKTTKYKHVVNDLRKPAFESELKKANAAAHRNEASSKAPK